MSEYKLPCGCYEFSDTAGSHAAYCPAHAPKTDTSTVQVKTGPLNPYERIRELEAQLERLQGDWRAVASAHGSDNLPPIEVERRAHTMIEKLERQAAAIQAATTFRNNFKAFMALAIPVCEMEMRWAGGNTNWTCMQESGSSFDAALAKLREVQGA